MSRRCASRAAVNRPSCSALLFSSTRRSNSGGRDIIEFARSRISSSMPRPWSAMSTATPRATAVASTCTCVFGGENAVALSISSEIRWIASPTAAPLTMTSGTCPMTTREYWSISETDERNTSISATGRLHRRPGCWSPSTSRFSTVRRARVVELSSSNSLASCAEFSSLRSSWSMVPCMCRSRRWIRCAMPTNTTRAPCRARVSPTAASTASCWNSWIAWATWPTSSLPKWSSATISVSTLTASPSRSRRTTSGSFRAIASDSVRRPCSRVSSASSTTVR